MDKDSITKCMESILKSMVSSEEEECRDLVKEALKDLQGSKLNFSNPERFNLFLVYKLKNGLQEIAKTMHDIPKDGIKDKSKVDFIYLNYDFLENHIRKLCILREGSSCCADKSRRILKMYLQYSLTGEIPNFNPSEENFATPKFGTYEEWIIFCDGLYHLFYGNTEQYFNSYNTLLIAPKRKYKHILHTWYIKFKDKEVIEFSNTWDAEDKNPLDNEFLDKDTFYILYGSYIKNRGYASCENMIGYYKVPKDDIDEIYKISQEKLI